METIRADFAISDDMLQEAASKRLAGHGPIVIEKSGRIGPTVELTLASFQFPDEFRAITIKSGFSTNLRRAIQASQSFGGGINDVAGAFPLSEENPVTSSDPLWDQWTMHAENAAKSNGLNATVVASLMGALGEIQDNVYEHSEAPNTGVVAYAVTPTSFEFVVADRGIGVLQTLRQNPAYADVPDAGVALQEIIKDGVSRFPAEAGRGLGFNQLFRGLVGHNAELRFRSGDHALTLRPTKDMMHGETVLAQVAPLEGFAVSVFYRAGRV